MEKSEKPPIINCHIHVFTGDYVPPYLSKTYLPFPFYYLLSIRWVINILRWYYKNVKSFYYTNKYKKWKIFCYKIEIFFKRNYIFGVLKFFIETYIVVSIFYNIGIRWFEIYNPNYTGLNTIIIKFLIFIKESRLIVEVQSIFYGLILFAFILFFFKSIRNLVFGLFKLFKILPGKNFTRLVERYVQIGLFSKYKTQRGIYDKLKKQYPVDTHFVCLPMDMEFMKAGKLKKVYYSKTKKRNNIYSETNTIEDKSIFAIRHQMRGILKIKKRKEDKNSFHPFVFADPRRMRDRNYFDYTVNKKGDVNLVPGCLMQEYLEVHQFEGVKIYPAIGYYPFAEELLPLWKYCQHHNLPIMTHCISGTIFYRGKKKMEWDKHPIFKESKIDDDIKKKQNSDKNVDFNIDAEYIISDDNAKGNNYLNLNQTKNIDFCNNFTNPLNYLCLLEDNLLKQVVEKSSDPRIKSIFYDKAKHWRKGGLQNLKICFAHFGGDDQWKRFLESDRDNYTSQLILKPEKGIDFFNNYNNQPSPGKLAIIWRHVDWYTIICSIMLQYENVYADVSYILHDEVILPLLKQTLRNEKLKTKILYGTDFYVVRNHKSDKAILSDMQAGLTEDEFDQIARYNPRMYINLKNTHLKCC